MHLHSTTLHVSVSWAIMLHCRGVVQIFSTRRHQSATLTTTLIVSCASMSDCKGIEQIVGAWEQVVAYSLAEQGGP